MKKYFCMNCQTTHELSPSVCKGVEMSRKEIEVNPTCPFCRGEDDCRMPTWYFENSCGFKVEK